MDLAINLLIEKYANDIHEFILVTQRQQKFIQTLKLKYSCKNNRNVKKTDVWKHLYLNGFKTSYKIWCLHEETLIMVVLASFRLQIC